MKRQREANSALCAIGDAMDIAVAQLNTLDESTNRDISVWYSYNDGVWKWAWNA
jgi:hypothetical protein